MNGKHWITLLEAREMEESMWKALSKRRALGHEWLRGGLHARYPLSDAMFFFEAGNAVMFSVSAGRSLWLHMYVNSKEHKGEDFDCYPKSVLLRWNRNAKNTAHNILAIVQMAIDSMEKREASA